jgi:hypothetical protein
MLTLEVSQEGRQGPQSPLYPYQQYHLEKVPPFSEEGGAAKVVREDPLVEAGGAT